VKTINLRGLRVAALAADGVEQIELTKPLKALQRAGAAVEVVSLRKGKIQAMNLMVPGKKIAVDRVVKDADPALYDALLLPGGHINPDFLRKSDAALEFVRHFDMAGKPIAVICHGPWVLVSAGLVEGRRLTSWPNIQDDIRNAGGAWEDAAVVRDRNWVSSRGPQDLPAFEKAMLQLFGSFQPMRPHAELDQPRKRRGGLGWLLGALAAAGAGYAYTRTREQDLSAPVITGSRETSAGPGLSADKPL
jgi:protease I